MLDREKVIAELQEYHDREWTDERKQGVPARDERKRITGNALDLLKEQEVQKFFVDESGKITPLPIVVRCKDCAHGSLWCRNIKCVKH